MMKYLFLLLLLCSGATKAQTPYLVTKLASLPPPLAATPAVPPDTVAALHRLFAAKRRKLLPIVGGTAAAGAAGIALIGATVEGGGQHDGRVVGQGLVGILGVLIVGTEVLFYSTSYSKDKEQRAVAAFAVHQLPHHLQRQLKAKYFR